MDNTKADCLCHIGSKPVLESFSLNWRNALVFHHPLNEGCVALIALTLNSFSLSCNSALGEPTLEVIGVSGAREDDGEAEDKKEDPSGGSYAFSLRSFLRDI